MSDALQILVGDCRETLRSLPDGSVNCCVTSPPYWGLRDYGHGDQIGQESHPDIFVNELVAVFREVRRVLADDGTVWLNLGDSYEAQRGGTQMPAETLAGGEAGKGDDDAHRGRQIISAKTDDAQESAPSRNAPIAHRNARGIGLKHKDLVGIPWRVAFALQADGWYLRQDIIWHKPNPMPESVTDRCTKAHEYVFLLSKSASYYFQTIDFREHSKKGAAGSKFDKGKTAKHQADRSSAKPRKETGFRNRRSVWTIPTASFKGAHFATFPPDLVRPCIRAGCPIGGTVLDPFGGSGTTGMVALELGCKAVICELNPEYVAMIRERCQVSWLPLEEANA